MIGTGHRRDLAALSHYGVGERPYREPSAREASWRLVPCPPACPLRAVVPGAAGSRRVPRRHVPRANPSSWQSTPSVASDAHGAACASTSETPLGPTSKPLCRWATCDRRVRFPCSPATYPRLQILSSGHPWPQPSSSSLARERLVGRPGVARSVLLPLDRPPQERLGATPAPLVLPSGSIPLDPESG